MRSVFADPFPQRFGDQNRAVGLLVVLQDGDDRAADGDGRAVERVDELRAFFAFHFVADVEPAGLVVGAVRGAGDFAILAAVAAAGHPGFQVELAIGRAAEVAGGDVEHAVGNAEAVEDLAFEVAEVVVHVLALLGQREGEHLDLGELMHAIQAARRPAGRAGFGAEAVADAAQLDRQLFGFDDLTGIQAAERDLGRRDEVQVVFSML